MATRTDDKRLGTEVGLSNPSWLEDPAFTPVRLRPPHRAGAAEHFTPTDASVDLARHPLVDRVLRSRKFQFLLILPNQIVFWLVIISGLAGTVVPGLNFGTAITWYIWFCLVFVSMVVVGRAWCAMCPFGGFAEWVQRHTFFKRTFSRPLTLGVKLPARWAGYGLTISLGSFLVLTWIEEYFGIAGPGNPADTSWMVLGIVVCALAFFLVFERRTFCRYVCPLSSLIGSAGAMGSAAGFRTRDREVCLTCKTKDCMRGGERGYGCPWYTWPGSADSNLVCGLCSECYKACPSNNVGLFLQKPLTSVVAPVRRRLDVAWAIAFLFGLVAYQQVNALSWYTGIDDTANRWVHDATGLPASMLHYPNIAVYLLMVAVGGALLAAGSWFVMTTSRATALSMGTAKELDTGKELDTANGTKTAPWRAWFQPVMYGLVPLMGADYLARQLPKFWHHATRIAPAVVHPFGGHLPALYKYQILGDTGVVRSQLMVVGLGLIGSFWATWRISKRDLEPLASRPLVARLSSLLLVLVTGVGVAACYIAMHAAE